MIQYLLPLSTASVDPPQLPETSAPALHCGIFPARHLPLVFFAVPCRNTGPQAAVGQLAIEHLLGAR